MYTAKDFSCGPVLAMGVMVIGGKKLHSILHGNTYI